MTCIGIMLANLGWLIAICSFFTAIGGFAFGYWIGRKEGFALGRDDALRNPPHCPHGIDWDYCPECSH